MSTMNFVGKTVFITGASRGIGKCIALAFAKEKANVVCFGKTSEPHKTLPGTVHETVSEINSLGGKGLACIGDVRFPEDISKAIDSTVSVFGGIDILINNASALYLKKTLETPINKFDLMHNVNVRGTFLCSQAALPYLYKSNNPHIITLSPPILMNPKWLADHLAYTMSKFGMSMCVLGMAEEFKSKGVAVNAIWPKTCIYTSSLIVTVGKESFDVCRKPEIISDSVLLIASKDSKEFSGNLLIDEDFLRSSGVTDFDKYSCKPGQTEFLPDLFVETSTTPLMDRVKNEEKPLSVSQRTQINEFFNKVALKIETNSYNDIDLIVNINISDQNSNEQNWFIDLKNTNKKCMKGRATEDAIELTLSSTTMSEIISKKTDPISAMSAGKLKMSCGLSQAAKINKLFQSLLN